MSSGTQSNTALTPSHAPAADPALRLGVYLPTWNRNDGSMPRWPEIRALARLAEEAGVDTLWVADHFRPLLPDGSIQRFWECWTLLSAVADATSRVTLGPLITPTAFRPPALLVKMALTLDAISDGRLILALGAGAEREIGFELTSASRERRASMFAEALQIIVPLLRTGHADFAGDYYHVRDYTHELHSLRPHTPPIWIAAQGPRMLTLAARWANAVNLNRPVYAPADLSTPLAMLDSACAAVGRDPATLMCTGSTTITFAAGRALTGPRTRWLHGSPNEIAASLLTLRAAGLSHITCYLDDTDDQPGPAKAFPLLTARAIERFAPVIAAVRASDSHSPVLMS